MTESSHCWRSRRAVIKGRGVLLLAAALVACGRPAPLSLEIESGGGGQRLEVRAAPGLRLNARLAPALELADGRVIRFTSPVLTADSAYFAVAPTAWLPGGSGRPHGLLRAGVCVEGTLVCRVVAVRL